jgi:RNA polymerase sigma factor (sigma-70 family)
VTDWRAVRRLVPEVLSALVRRHGHFDACEDAVQEALLAAAAQWPVQGWPDNPKAWLVTVASRRLTDQLRSNAARRRREEAEAARTPPPLDGAEFGDAGSPPASDDTLTLLFLCCHPALSPASQVALTLRAVGGLSTAEIAGAFLVPEATMAQRISRAKQRIKAAGATFELPPRTEHARRLGVVVHVLYLIFNEGYTATSGDAAGASRVAGARRTRRAGCGHRNQRCATQPLRALRGPLADQLARPGGCRRTDWTTTRCALTRTFVVPAGGPNRTAFEPSTNP